MVTVRNAIYALVAAGSLFMAGVQAIAGEEEVAEASAIGLGQSAKFAQPVPAPTRMVRRATPASLASG